MNKREIGRTCEDCVCELLVKNNYEIAARNFYVGRSPEIDIVAVKDGVLHFIEVKARSGGNYGLPKEAVSADKIKKIRKSSELFMKSKNIYDMELSYDVVEVFFKIKEEHLEICDINILYEAY